MQLTPEQQRVVEENMGLVGRVLKDKVHGIGQQINFTYDDLFQIGCIGLCKAAATDKGGCFSTYAYRLIWNEICDELIKTSRIQKKELVVSPQEVLYTLNAFSNQDMIEAQEKRIFLEQAKDRASELQKNGIICLELSAKGFTSKEIGEHFGVKAATARMWMTAGRRFLQSQPEFNRIY